MGVLHFQKIRKLVKTESLVENVEDLDKQLQSAGIDLRLGRVYEAQLYSREGIGFLKKNGSRRLPKLKLVAESDGETVVFHRGNSYVLETRESVNLPNDMTARIQPRMSTCLLGLSLSTADVDAGYKGGLRFSAYCVSPCEIEIGTRFCQVIFNRLE